jgi:two-component system, cell cycle response regulator
MKNALVPQIAQGIYWVGGELDQPGLQCNPYLLVDGEEAVLIDPGSVLDFGYVYENVRRIISPEKVKYVILHHQDPDLCSSVPLFERNGFNFQIATHWRTQMLVRYYGVRSDYYIVNNNQFRLTLESGRVLSFIPSPYLHFPGAIMTYDEKTKTLFSSDLFGAFSDSWNLYAQEDYIEKMKTFHEHYMPSNEILRPVMETLLKIPIDIIAPQHGSIIDHQVKDHIKVLRDLECGSLLRPVKKDLDGAGGYIAVCNAIIKRYVAIYGKDEVLDALGDLGGCCDGNMQITEAVYPGYQLWDLIFERAYARKGMDWLLSMEPYARSLSKQYDIPVPRSFDAYLMQAEQESRRLSRENQVLAEAAKRLEENLREVQDQMTRSTVTGLYNFEFFKNYLSKEMDQLAAEPSGQNPALIIIGLDQMEKVRYRHGDGAVDEIFKKTALILEELKEDYEICFKLQGALFACYITHTGKQEAMEVAESIRNAIAGSKKYMEPVTASLGVVSFQELQPTETALERPEEKLYNTAIARVRIAKNRGRNLVCGTSDPGSGPDEAKHLLLVDSDRTSLDVLKTFLENLGYSILAAGDGEHAQRLAEQYKPFAVITEIMLPKLDGFLLRQALLASSDTKDIPFVFVSHLKTDDSLRRASALGVKHYLKKPFMLTELTGIISNLFKEESRL